MPQGCPPPPQPKHELGETQNLKSVVVACYSNYDCVLTVYCLLHRLAQCRQSHAVAGHGSTNAACSSSAAMTGLQATPMPCSSAFMAAAAAAAWPCAGA